MTTFQDPPPQSRRSARQSERSDGHAAPAEFGQFPSADTQEQVFFDQTQPPVAQPQPSQLQPSRPEPSQPDGVEPFDQARPSGRRSRTAASAGLYEMPPAAESHANLTFGQVAQPTGEIPPVAPHSLVDPPAEPTPFRVRDFSPEGGGRRSAVPPLIEPEPYVQQPYSAAPSNLDYRTQAGPVDVPVAQPVAVPTPTAVHAQPVAAEAPEHQTLSRRELRQRQAAADAVDAPAPIVETPVTPPPIVETPVTPPPIAQAPVMAPPVAQQPIMQQPVMQQPTVHQPAPSALETAMDEFDLVTQTRPPVQSHVVQPPPPTMAPTSHVVVDPVFIEPELEHTGGYSAPAGHWSRQADLDDETQPWENTITREVGGSNVATTTSTLVLPEIPQPNHFSTALNSTGEILLTGSISLPASLGSGAGDARRYDDPTVDSMFEAQDGEFSGTDSAPVRAIRAVSTHTSSRGVIHANKPHGNRMLMVLLVTAIAMAVGVVTLLVVTLAQKPF